MRRQSPGRERRRRPISKMLPFALLTLVALADAESFTLAAGQFLHFEVRLAAGLRVSWVDPAGEAHSLPDCPYDPLGAVEGALVASVAGSYRLEVKPAGAYQLRVLASRQATPGDLELVAALGWFDEADRERLRRTPAARQAALAQYAKAAAVFRSAGRAYLESKAVYLLGAVKAESGDFAGARDTFLPLAALLERIGERTGQAAALNFAGGMLDVLGDPQSALAVFARAEVLFEDPLRRAQVLSNTGKLQANLTNWQAALDNYRRALALVRQAGGAPGMEANVLHNLAATHATLGDFDQAIPLFEQAVPLRRAAKDQRGEADTLTSLGRTHALLKRPAKALEYYAEALIPRLAVADRRGESSTRAAMGLAHAELGQSQMARENLAQALALARASQDKRGEATVQLQTAQAGMIADPAAVPAAAEAALAGYRAFGDRDGEAKALDLLARAADARADLPAARAFAEAGLRVVEGNRGRTESQQLRASYFATRQESYAFYIDLLMRQGDTAAALEASERGRARGLVEQLAESGVDIRAGVDPALLERERTLTGQLAAKAVRAPSAALLTEIRTLERDLEELQTRIRLGSPRYAAVTQPSPLRLAGMQQLLDDDTLLLEYALGEPRSYLWVVGKQSLRGYPLPSRRLIEDKVASVYAMITQRDDASLPTAARELQAMILGPAALKAKRLAIVPDGGLQRLPFSLLLLDTHETVTLPSASTLALLRDEIAGRSPAPKQLAVFADPVFDADQTPAPDRILEHLDGPVRPRIPRLPYTRQEASEILKAAPRGENLSALGLAANRMAVLSPTLGQYRYLHFATHGYLDAERPGLSALLLSMLDERNQPTDGFLRVNDIYNLKLPAELVVLSACQTGLGKEVRGEGLLGLTRAFLYAGAARVVVSLWSVNDRATADLMAGLYRRMLRNGLRPSAALREAQLELRKQKRWQSPYYWAAFVQTGEWR